MSDKWFFVDGEQTRGPYTRVELEREIEKGRVQERTFVWRRGMSVWMPAENINEIRKPLSRTRQLREKMAPPPRSVAPASFPAPPRYVAVQPSPYGTPSGGVQVSSVAPTPWRRFAAKIIDQMFEFWTLWAAFLLIAGAFSMEVDSNTQVVAAWVLVVIAAYLFFDAIILSSFNTTLGKWIFGLSVRRRDGASLRFRDAIARSVGVIVIGFGLFILFPITGLFAFQRLVQKGETYWDQIGHFSVIAEPIKWGRVIIGCLLVAAAIFALMSITGLATQSVFQNVYPS
jgi:uncharacterized RDD family membrane protein YckC